MVSGLVLSKMDKDQTSLNQYSTKIKIVTKGTVNVTKPKYKT